MSKTSRAVQTLMALEDAAPSEIFEEIAEIGIPLWPLVRQDFGAAFADAETGAVGISRTANAWEVRRRLVKALLPSRWDARGFRGRRDVCFLVGGNTTTHVGGREGNWLIGDFAEQAAKRSVVFQWRALPSAYGPPAFPATRSLDPALARADFVAHRRQPSAATVRTVERLVDRFAELIDAPMDDARLADAKASAMKLISLQLPMKDEIDRMLDHVQPRVVLFEDGSYGYRGAYIAQIRAQGALVAEPQHGWIGGAHVAYNYGAAYAQPALARTLPEELLTFGDLWSESIRHPARLTSIGKPHLARRAAAAPRDRDREVLIVSSVADPAETDEFVMQVRSSLPTDWSVRFRPHPGERDMVGIRYPRIASSPDVELDLDPDVYDALSRARAVIGVASTVLFEAAAFGCQVLVRDTSFAEFIVGDTFGARLRSAEEAVSRLLSAATKDLMHGPTDSRLWADAPTNRFGAWLDDRLSQKAP